MATAVLSPLLTPQFFANTGQFLAGGLLYVFQAGTSTPATTYTDNTGTTPNTNPIVLNSRGEASIWVPSNTSLKFTLTDSAGNFIWTRDQVIANQLLTLFAGVDTGGVGAYVVNLSPSFSSLTNGIILYWVASNANNGPSTLTVNSFGTQPILSQIGAPLTQGMIVAGNIQGTMYYNGNWILLTTNNYTGNFPVVYVGGTSTPSGTAFYSLNGSTVTLALPYLTATSNSTTFGILGLPTSLQTVRGVQCPLANMVDNGSPIGGCYTEINAASSNILFIKPAGASWTATGTKASGTSGFYNYITYSLI